ncbi:MAG: PD-(D/E)XK nuclease family protein [Deltaproteobacteria bacterium]|nr:PD-(D/E)XK nuclease family protein [Deltaproteobacteria bacterium]
MGTRFVIAGDNRTLTEAAVDFLGAHAGSGRGLLLVAPTRRAADDLVRIAARRFGLLGGVISTTLLRLASELALVPLAESGCAVASSIGSRALAARVTHGAELDGELEYFGPVARTPGFPRAVERTLLELRAGRVALERLEALGPAGTDLRRLLERMERDGANRVDAAGLHARAADWVERGRHPWLGLPIVFSSVTPRSAVEELLVGALLRRATGALLTALESDEVAVRSLERASGVIAEKSKAHSPRNSLERIRARVFGDAAERSSMEELGAEPDESFELFSASNEARECVEIARRCRLAARRGVRFDEMAIFLRAPRTYQPLLEDSFRRAEIPLFFTQGASRPNEAGRAFLALLAMVEENFSASRFAEYLSLGQVPELDEEGGPRRVDLDWVAPTDTQLVFRGAVAAELVDDSEDGFERPPSLHERAVASEVDSEVANAATPAVAGTLRVPRHFERLLVEASVIGGRERWARRLEGLARELDRQLESLVDDPDRLEGRRRERMRLENLRRFALPIVDRLAELPAAASWREWLMSLDALAGRVLRRPDSVRKVLADLWPMGEVGPVGIREVRSVLAERLLDLRDDSPSRRFGKVFVGVSEEAAGRTFRIVFVPGLAEGVFPRKALEDPLLLDESRRRLSAELDDQPRRFARERGLLRGATAAAREKLVASWPRTEVREGRPRVPSFYALDLIRAAEGSVPKLDDLERRASLVASAERLGWPAPEDPFAAIDDTEYDLATLVRLLAQPAAAASGGAAYLVAANPSLARALRARAQRHRSGWGFADGLVDVRPETLRILEAERPTARSYSPTGLQDFAECPYKFYLKSIFRLRPRDEIAPLETVDPRTRGAIHHSVLFKLLTRLRTEGRFPLTSEGLGEAFELTDLVLNATADEMREELSPAIPRVFGQAIESMRQDLRGWLRRMAEQEPEWAPLHLELAFGLTDLVVERDPGSIKEDIEVLTGYRVRGSIDVVERCLGDEPGARGGALRVTDHKTGRPPSPRPKRVGGGRHLQPVLYALAAEKILGERVPTSRLYFSTERGGFDVIELSVDDAARAALASVFAHVDHAVKTGFLPAAPAKDACARCDFAVICGDDAERIVKKKMPLESLSGLRKLP